MRVLFLILITPLIFLGAFVGLNFYDQYQARTLCPEATFGAWIYKDANHDINLTINAKSVAIDYKVPSDEGGVKGAARAQFPKLKQIFVKPEEIGQQTQMITYISETDELVFLTENQSILLQRITPKANPPAVAENKPTKQSI